MPRKVAPASEFGRRLYALRTSRGLTQIQLAEAVGSSQRAISHYETVAEYPPTDVLVQLARGLRVSTDELLGLKNSAARTDDPDTQRLWKKFRQVLTLSEKDRRAIIRMINSLAAPRASAGAHHRIAKAG